LVPVSQEEAALLQTKWLREANSEAKQAVHCQVELLPITPGPQSEAVVTQVLLSTFAQVVEEQEVHW